MPILRLCLWSGPRNVSTALMYAFAQRPDTRVVDEPLYAHYLRVSGAEHPGRDEVLAAQDADGERVVRELICGPCDRPVLFLKQMAHHLVALDRGFLARTANVLLVREPARMLVSLARVLGAPSLRDTGLATQSALLDELLALGQDPAVLDAGRLLADPAGVLERLCRHVGLDFDPAMLRWPAGPRAEDGVWARHWYGAVWRSTGFEPPPRGALVVPAALQDVLAQCRPHYEKLRARAL